MKKKKKEELYEKRGKKDLLLFFLNLPVYAHAVYPIFAASLQLNAHLILLHVHTY